MKSLVAVTHIRQERWIRELRTGEVVDWKSINAAKRHSRILQRAGAVLRCGRAK